VKKGENWLILTLFSRVARLFVSLATLVAFFVGWQFIQARADVTKGRPYVIHELDMDSIRKAYEQNHELVPLIVEQIVTFYNQSGRGMALGQGSWDVLLLLGHCPQDTDQWKWLLKGETAVYCEAMGEWLRLAQEWLEEQPPQARDYFERQAWSQCKWHEELRQRIEANRELVSIVRAKFESGQPPGACSTSLDLAITGELDRQQLSFAADALQESEFIIVRMDLANRGNAAAPQVMVVAQEEGFVCEHPQGGEVSQCGPFDLEVGEYKTVQFRGQPGRFLDMSGAELAEIFTVKGGESQAIDKARILGLLYRAGLFTAATVMIDLVRKQRRYLVERFPNWGQLLVAIVCLVISILMLWAIIGFARLLAI